MANDLTALNSLRQALTPYDDVKFELNLNRHPKAHKNKSIIYAANMKLSKDGAVLENEESIENNQYVDDILRDYYDGDYKIVHIIPCNTELVLFVKGNDDDNFKIWRYRENTNIYDEKLALFYHIGIVYNGGKFSSTFTYTSNDSLIIAFCEYDSPDADIMNPIMTINLGTFTKGSYDSFNFGPIKYLWNSDIGEFNDRTLNPYKLPICPEINLPIIIRNYITTGNCYKGIYYFYIRYKINNYDHTQWFNFGYPIILDHKSSTIVNKKMTTNSKDKDAFDEDLSLAVETKYLNNLELNISNNVDLANSSIFINLGHIDKRYDSFDIGVMCVANTYTKYYVIEDLSNSTDNINIDIDKMKEEVFNTNIYENYYNVKNIVNKDNKLYISNYETSKNKQINVDDVKLNLIKNLEITEEQIGIKGTVSINGLSIPKEDYINVDYSAICIARDETTKGIFTSPGAPSSKYNKAKFINLCYYLNYIDCKHLIKESIKFKYIEGSNGLDGTASLIEKEVTINPKDYYISIHSLNNVVDDSIKLNTGIGLYKNTGFAYVIANKASIKYIKSQANNDILLNPTYYADESIPAYDQQAGDGFVNFTWVQINNGVESNTYKDFCSNDTIIIDGEDITSKLQDVNNINPSVPDYNPYAQLVDGKINDNIITSLCKGEIYDFYIHFIDKYGYVSDGYRLKNNDKQYYCYFNNPETNDVETHEICFINNIKESDGNNSCYMIPKTLKFYSYDKDANEYRINLPTRCCLVYAGDDAVDGFISSNAIANQEDVDRIISLFEKAINVSDYHKEILTWGDICDYIPEKLTPVFIDYTNIENHKLFRVPNIVRQYSSGIEKGNDISFALTVDIATVDSILNTYGFKSFFISHAKLEKTYLLDGFGNINYMTNVLLNNKANKIGNIIKQFQIPLSYWEDYTIPMSINNMDISSSAMEIFPNVTNNVAYTEDGQKYRTNRHTCVYFNNEFDSEITPNLHGINTKTNMDIYNISYLKTLNINKSIYVNKNVKLYRLGNILNSLYSVIKDGLNGIYKYHLGFWYGDEENGVVNISSSLGLTSYGHNYLFKIYDFYDDDENIMYLAESAKSVHIKGEKTESGGGTKEIDEKEIFYPVINTLNLFNYKVGNIYDTWINFYNIYNPNSDYLTEFNRTIYRSNVISDEGRTNNWRWFENDAYKNIEENKGNITNLLPIGNYLYVHTEHSLFAFSEDNTLSMNNQNLQVATPDIFDTEYKEVFISSLGYGGLQDKDSWISGQFGYIWFNNDTKQILKVYSNSMDIISKDIQEWLENCDVVSVRFANDIVNNRILINISVRDENSNIKDFTLSYNILSKTFISFHDYHFTKGYNTKNKLYYLTNDMINQYNKNSYGANVDEQKRYSVSFIVNNYYNVIKYLEYIVYKLRKRNIKSEDYISSLNPSFSDFPVEQELVPFAGNGIRVFNDIIDTGNIPFDSIDYETNKPKNTVNDFKTPYWDLGNWNFNYLRDMNNSVDSRLYGNYFVIRFFFGNVDTLIEFEDFDVNITKDKNL